MMKRLVFGCAVMAAALGEAQTMTLWRGEWAAGDTFLCYPNGEPSWRFLELRNGIVAAEKLRILSADREFAPKLAELRRIFRVSEAVEGRCDFRKIREAVLKAVN